MYNMKFTQSDLPTRAQLLRSSLVAIVVATFLAVAVVLPAEYGTDPTGIGKLVGLTDMGAIKQELAKEAEVDRALDGPGAPATGVDKRSSVFSTIVAQLLIGTAEAQTLPVKSEKMSVTLKPNQGAEIKLTMKKGNKATYVWAVVGGNVNYDMHGEPDKAPNATHSYKKGRFTENDKGTLEAKFDGNHGWFWRNRTDKEVTVTIEAQGEFAAMKRVL